ncbi:MAG: TIGR00341 family protein [Gammaproteobacteria bacterium]|nr:TIGR00341 family protein [Gammaproteobacteria bacterium]
MKIIEVVANESYNIAITGIAEHFHVVDYWQGPIGKDDRRACRILVEAENAQPVLDALQGLLAKSEDYRIVIIQPEVSLPRRKKDEDAEPSPKGTSTSREELYNNVEKNARLDSNFLILVFFSTIVAAIGLIEDNVAVVIGAMVIAPLLGPNLALALGTALGDGELIRKALVTNLGGLTVATLLSISIALLWPVDLESSELHARTVVGLDSVALALASGAAAVLSLTTGLSSVLVGVMVAVALLPPTATFGLMVGSQQWDQALGALILLAVNIVCVNLSAKLVFLYRGIRPRTWLEKRRARQSMWLYIIVWLLSLGLLIGVIYLRTLQ